MIIYVIDALGPTQPPIQWVLGLSGGKVDGACRWPSTPSSSQAKELVELYVCSPPRPSQLVLGWPLPLPNFFFIYNWQWRDLHLLQYGPGRFWVWLTS